MQPGQRASQLAASANQGASQLSQGLNTAAQRTSELTAAASQLAQAAGPAINSLKLAMANLQRQQGATFGGGAAGYFGGDDTADPAKGLREYEASLSAKAKEDVIRRLARALKRAGINVDDTADPDTIVKVLVESIPNPKKNGKTFSADAKSQEKICRTVADVLNDEFSPGVTKASEKFIDTSLGAVEMCRSVGDWVHSFAMGVNTEFLAVHTSVRNALQQITILDQVMADLWGKIQSRVGESGDAKLGREVDPLAEVYNRAQAERRRQEELLKNILQVRLAPALKELEMAMKDESEQNALIKRLGLKPGTSEFADTLAMAISGLGTAASVAQRVNKALKQVGESVRQYLDSPDFASFRRALDQKVESGKVKAEDLAEFLEAVDTLRHAFGSKDDARFREALEAESKTGGRRGGADEEKTPIAKRVEREMTEKKVIIRDFASRMSRHYDELLAAVKAMGPKLGKEIPLTDKTDALRDALSRLNDMRAQSQRLELALVGRYIDADARQRKETFVNTLRVVANACSAVMELEIYRGSSTYFARLKAAIEGIEKTIDYFTDVVTKKFGGEEPVGDDEVAELYGGRRGGANEDVSLPEIARSGLSLAEAVSEFAYFYYVARVRANLEQTSKELDSYGEKYTELLGDAVAARLYTLEKERKAINDRLVPGGQLGAGAQLGVDNVGVGGPNLSWLPPAPAVARATPAQDAALAAVKQWVADEFDTKAKFYRALQAMDLYMKSFTVAIAKDPNAVMDFKKILDGTQVIARWFSDQTGEFIWQAFDRMGSTNFAAVVENKAGLDVVQDADTTSGKHYYQRVSAETESTFGVPEIGVRPVGGDKDPATAVKKAVSNAYDHFQALKNLVNAFARVGDKFGGQELRSKVFMSPAQVYKVLIDYLKQSALSINTQDRNLQFGAVATAVAPLNVYFGSVAGGATTTLGNYVIEDRYFALIIKAMAAKILTVLGVYDMFERTSPLSNLTPTRMIIGGYDGNVEPDVLEGAAELYFRLPRLAEFFRSFLRWDGKDGGTTAIGTDTYKIAILPELEGIFSGIIRLIFQKAAAADTGDYSDSELRQMIAEINTIYEHFNSKNPGQATKSALAGFVTEINRRYGLIRQKDMKEYWDLVDIARASQTGRLINDTNYTILPDEEESEAERRAPSDRFGVGLPGRYDPATGLPVGTEPFSGRTQLDTEGDLARKMLRDFRTLLDQKLLSVGKDNFGARTYALLIQQAESEIRRTQARDGKLKIAFRLIQGTTVIGTDANKAFMFHETVVTGLNILSAIEAVLRRFSNALEAMNPITIESAIMDAVYAFANDQAYDPNGDVKPEESGGAALAAVAGTRAGLLNLIAGRNRKFRGAGAGAGLGGNITPFDRYLLAETGVFAGRSGIPLDVRVADVYTFLGCRRGRLHCLAR